MYDHNEGWSTVGIYRDPIVAQTYKTLLEGSGFTVFLKDEFTITMNWLYSQAIGGIKLQVPIDQAEAACELLQDSENML